jgi:hypothetical protein
VSQRFQIEDLVDQDNSGVVFRALDTKAGGQVALRRFFPFGGKGGGLDTEEQIAYGLAIQRLAGVSHTALRSVISGGCDPVDGMPFVATEWIEGTPLQALVERGPIALGQVVELLLQILEVCQFLSESLGEVVMWVDTNLNTIVIGAVERGRRITFWFAPERLLGSSDHECVLSPIITLAEAVIDRSGKVAPSQVGMGLDRWLKWLRGASTTTSFLEAREMLVSCVGVNSAAPTKHLAHQTARSVIASHRKKSSKMPAVAVAALVLLALGAGSWFLVKKNEMTLGKAEKIAVSDARIISPQPEVALVGRSKQQDAEPTTASVETVVSKPGRDISPEEASRRATELLAARQDSERELQARRSEIQQRGGIFEVGDHALLLEQKNAEVRLRGQVTGVQFSDKGKGATLYVDFLKSDSRFGVRGFVRREDLNGALSLASLENFVGKTIQVRGKVTTPTSRSRPEIEIRNFDSIQEVR